MEANMKVGAANQRDFANSPIVITVQDGLFRQLET
jgi:hypothetical protein